MARIPSVEESTSDGFVVPDMGAYTVELVRVEDAGQSKLYGNNQEKFVWVVLDDGAFQGVEIFDWVNVDSFYNGKGKQPKAAHLYRIVRALMGDKFDEKRRPEDTALLVGKRCRILLVHKDNGKGKIERYQAMLEQPEPEAEPPAVDVDAIPF